jgi:hypothetical protein
LMKCICCLSPPKGFHPSEIQAKSCRHTVGGGEGGVMKVCIIFNRISFLLAKKLDVSGVFKLLILLLQPKQCWRYHVHLNMQFSINLESNWIYLRIVHWCLKYYSLM